MVYTKIECNLQGIPLETPLFEHEDSCLLFVKTYWPQAKGLITIKTTVFKSFEEYVVNNENKA